MINWIIRQFASLIAANQKPITRTVSKETHSHGIVEMWRILSSLVIYHQLKSLILIFASNDK